MRSAAVYIFSELSEHYFGVKLVINGTVPPITDRCSRTSSIKSLAPIVIYLTSFPSATTYVSRIAFVPLHLANFRKSLT